jgi:hypothetical protein
MLCVFLRGAGVVGERHTPPDTNAELKDDSPHDEKVLNKTSDII